MIRRMRTLALTAGLIAFGPTAEAQNAAGFGHPGAASPPPAHSAPIMRAPTPAAPTPFPSVHPAPAAPPVAAPVSPTPQAIQPGGEWRRHFQTPTPARRPAEAPPAHAPTETKPPSAAPANPTATPRMQTPRHGSARHRRRPPPIYYDPGPWGGAPVYDPAYDETAPIYLPPERFTGYGRCTLRKKKVYIAGRWVRRFVRDCR